MAMYDRAVTMLIGVLGHSEAVASQFTGPATIDAAHLRLKDTGDGGVYEYWESGDGVGHLQRVGSGALNANLPRWMGWDPRSLTWTPWTP